MVFFVFGLETLVLVALVGICWGIGTDSIATLKGKEIGGLEVAVGIEVVLTSLT